MKILDGKRVKEKILNELKEKIEKENLSLRLAVIQVGEEEASNIYLKQKRKVAEELNIEFNHIKLDEDSTEKEIIDQIEILNKENSIDGILIQLPLPKHLEEEKIQSTISPLKDVDGLTDINIGRLIHNKTCLISPTAMGTMELLKYYNVSVEGKNVVIIGRSNLVGKPLAMLMSHANATVSLCHSKTKNLKLYTKNADIIVVAIGCPNFIKKEDIKEDVIIIDVGINRLKDNTICGDVDFYDVKEKVSLITPVPGGVGQLTPVELFQNVYLAHHYKEYISDH